MKCLVLLPALCLFVTIAAQDNFYSLNQLLKRGIGSDDYNIIYDFNNVWIGREGSKPNHMLKEEALRYDSNSEEDNVVHPPYPPTNPYGGPVQMYTVAGGPLLPGQLIVSAFDRRRGGVADFNTPKGGIVDFDTRRRGEVADFYTPRSRVADFDTRRGEESDFGTWGVESEFYVAKEKVPDFYTGARRAGGGKPAMRSRLQSVN